MIITHEQDKIRTFIGQNRMAYSCQNHYNCADDIHQNTIYFHHDLYLKTTNLRFSLKLTGPHSEKIPPATTFYSKIPRGPPSLDVASSQAVYCRMLLSGVEKDSHTKTEI